MAPENPKNPLTNAWTSITVRGGTADAVEAFQVSYRKKHGKNISQDLVVLAALRLLKVTDLPAPQMRAKTSLPTLANRN